VKLYGPIYAIIDPADGRILADGECSSLTQEATAALSATKPDEQALKWVATFCGCPAAKVVQCRIVPAEELARLRDDNAKLRAAIDVVAAHSTFNRSQSNDRT
jgi:hypothetical protein